MIVDVHAHPHRFSTRGQPLGEVLRPDGSWEPGFVEEFEQHTAAADKVVVIGVDAPRYWMHTSNDFIARFVERIGPRAAGFASVNPNRADAADELERAVRELGLQGLKLAPIYQDFEPESHNAYRVYQKAQELGIPIMWHQGTSLLARFGPLEAATPVRLDRVLRDFPDIPMVFSHLCYPWALEGIAMARKHPQLWLDISANERRPWFTYNAIVAAMEYGVADKLLFGTDYPFQTVESTAAALRALKEIPKGTGLPPIPDEVIEGIIHRDAWSMLGLDRKTR